MKVVSDATMAHVMTNTSQLLPENAHDLLRQVEMRILRNSDLVHP